MKNPNTYTLRIVGSHPKKLTLERMALYLAELAKLMGEKDKVHFYKLTTSSAALQAWPEDEVADKVSSRIGQIVSRANAAPKEGLAALERINDLLIQDGTRGELKNPANAVIYPFPGGKKEDIRPELTLEQESTIIGQVIKIGGRDETIPVLIKDSEGREYNCTIIGSQLSREIAANYLGDPIELSGKGRWKRSYKGTWELVSLRIRTWSKLSDDWDSSIKILESIGKKWSEVEDVEAHLSSLRKGY